MRVEIRMDRLTMVMTRCVASGLGWMRRNEGRGPSRSWARAEGDGLEKGRIGVSQKWVGWGRGVGLLPENRGLSSVSSFLQPDRILTGS